LDELILGSVTLNIDRSLLLASRDDLAMFILERLQNGSAENISTDGTHRYGIRRLLVRLCVDSETLHPSLFPTAIRRADIDLICMGGYAGIFQGTYSEEPRCECRIKPWRIQ